MTAVAGADPEEPGRAVAGPFSVESTSVDRSGNVTGTFRVPGDSLAATVVRGDVWPGEFSFRFSPARESHESDATRMRRFVDELMSAGFGETHAVQVLAATIAAGWSRWSDMAER